MKFDVVIGNVVTLFNNKHDYDDFERWMHHIGKITRFIEPIEWLNIFRQYGECMPYAIVEYTTIYDNEYLTRQIETILEEQESRCETMTDSEKLLMLISQQILVLSKKVDTLVEKVDESTDKLDSLDYPEIDTDEMADEIAEKVIDEIKEGYIDALSNLI